MKSNFFKYVFIIFVIGIMVFAFLKIKREEDEKKEIEQRISENTEEKITDIRLGIAGFDTLNPLLTNNKNIQDVTKLIYEPLVNISSDYKAEKCLAIEWAKQNDLVYIIKLRENVKWPNGERFTSTDVQYTIDRLKERNTIYSENVRHITSLEIVDDYTIKINLDQEVPFFEYYLNFPILSKSFYDSNDFNDTSIVAIGTGMYQVSDVQATYITLTKNTNWWNRDKELSLDKIIINIYGTVGELYNSFKIGNVDVINTSNINIQDYIGVIGYNLKEMKGREHTFLAFNTQNYFLAKPEVRKAISYSIDKENIISSIYNNRCYTSSFPLDYGSWVYQEQDASSGYNLEQAKQILIDNGWTYTSKYWQKYENYKSQRIVLNLAVKASDSVKVAIAENIKSQLENQGIRINVQKYTDEQYKNVLNTRNYDIILCTMNMSLSPDMTTFFGANNLANYNNEEVNNIMQEVKNTTDENVIKEKYKRLSEIYKTDIPYVSICTNKYTVAYNSSLVGDMMPNWYSPYYGIETWYK